MCLSPGSIEVHTVDFVVAPPGVDRGAETSVLGRLQSGEAIFKETLEARLGGLQHLHVLHTTVNHRDACVSWSE